MNYYIVIENGVFRHNILYVGSQLKVTVNVAKQLILEQPDDYHDLEIVRMPMGQTTVKETVICHIQRRDTVTYHPGLLSPDGKHYGPNKKKIHSSKITVHKGPSERY